MRPAGRRGEAIDVVLDNAAPILELTESAMALVPVPGLALIPKWLALLVDRVKVRRIYVDD